MRVGRRVETMDQKRRLSELCPRGLSRLERHQDSDAKIEVGLNEGRAYALVSVTAAATATVVRCESERGS